MIADVSGGGWAQVKMEFRDGGGVVLLSCATPVNTAVWTNYCTSCAAPPGTVEVQCYAQSSDASNGGTVPLWVDNFCVELETPPTVAGCPNNEFQNGTLEDGINFWGGWGTFGPSTDAAAGNGAAEVGPGTSGLVQTITGIVPGDSYYFRGMAKLIAGGAWAELKIEFQDASGTAVGDNLVNVTSSTYAPYETSGIAPCAATQAVAFLNVGGGAIIRGDELCFTGGAVIVSTE